MHPVFTIGHSRHSLETFQQLLATHAVEILVDVRASPWSRRYPQFGRESLATALATQGVRYRWLGEALGGLRRETSAHKHLALAEPAFRAYAEHMASPVFNDAIERLCLGAKRWRIALMCAEAEFAHCHRQFIADALQLRGVEVLHIDATASTQAHALHQALRVTEGVPRYDGLSQPTLFDPGRPA